jgi:hypothetical protein
MLCCNVMVNSDEIIGTTGNLTLYARCHINGRRYNRVRLYTFQEYVLQRTWCYIGAD